MVASEVLLRKTGAENDVEAHRFLIAPPLFARFFHVAAHELGAAVYAIRAVMESVPKSEREAARRTECEWQRNRIPAPIRELVLDDQYLRNEICWRCFFIKEPREPGCLGEQLAKQAANRRRRG